MLGKYKLLPIAILFAALIVGSLFSAFFVGCSDRSRLKTVRIALVFPFSGRMESAAAWAKRGAEMALEEINSRGGAAGFRFEALFIDDKSRPQYAEQAVEKAVTEENAEFIMGVLSSDVAIQVNEVARKYKKIFIGTAHASPMLGIEYFSPYYFNIRINSFQTSAAGALFLKELRKTKPWRTISYIGPDYSYGHRSYDDFLYNLERHRVDYRLLSVYWPKMLTRDYTSYITRILKDKPDILVIDLYGGDFREFLKQANQFQLFSSIIPCNFMAGGHYENYLPHNDMPPGMYVSGSNFVNWPDTKLHNDLIAKAHRRYHEYPSVMFADTYIAVHAIAKATEATGNPYDTDTMVKALEKMKLKTSREPDGAVSSFHPATHQIVVDVAIGKVEENRTFPPATKAPGDWKVFPGESLIPPMEYVAERKGNGGRMRGAVPVPAPAGAVQPHDRGKR